jgi:Protein of unknown function (DUF1176)
MSLSILLAATLAASAPNTGTLHSFGDWIVGCDNGRACQAVALMPDDMPDDSSTMVISRTADPEAQPSIRIVRMGQAVRVSVDGKAVRVSFKQGEEDLVILAGGAALVTAIKDGRELTSTDASNKILFRVSLNGASAALRYMDEQQKRAGTVTALVARGRKPASTMPLPPPLPVIISPPRSKRAPLTLPQAKLAEFNNDDECAVPESTSAEPSYGRLDAGHSVVLRPVLCGNGAYNFLSDVLVIDAKGVVSDADFDAEPATGFYNVGWDGNRLSTYYKGRGVGDCGERQSFAWDGKRFRLIEQDEMDRCGGSIDYIPTWRARVVGR